MQLFQEYGLILFFAVFRWPTTLLTTLFHQQKLIAGYNPYSVYEILQKSRTIHALAANTGVVNLTIPVAAIKSELISWWAIGLYVLIFIGGIFLYIRVATRLSREELKYHKAQLDHLRKTDEIKSRELEIQKKYRRLFEYSLDAILVSDARGQIFDMNNAAEHLFGYKRDEICNIDYRELFPVSEEVEALNKLVLQKGQVTDFNITVVDRTGHMRECVISATVMLDEDGNISGYQGIVRDVTLRNKLEGELKILVETLKERERVLRKLSAAILNAQENERRRISRELHDEVGQAMTAINLSLQVLRRQRPEDKELQTSIDYCQRIAQHTATKIHNFSRELRSTVLEDHGLQAALESLAREFSRRTKIKVDLDFNIGDVSLPDELQLNLFRIVQEGLNNVAKHASASQVSIVVRVVNQEIQLSLKDNGRGFDLSSLDSNHPLGLGLLGMEERMLLFGGHLEIDSQPGKGTELKINIAL